jgi:hypothetical protein
MKKKYRLQDASSILQQRSVMQQRNAFQFHAALSSSVFFFLPHIDAVSEASAAGSATMSSPPTGVRRRIQKAKSSPYMIHVTSGSK